MYMQKGFALSLYDELDHQITLRTLKKYLNRNGWKLCYYGTSISSRKQTEHEPSSDCVGERIIQVAGIEDYARSVSSFTYLSKENRGVFINSAKKPSTSKIVRRILHEIGHIINGHEATMCILGKGNYHLEREAKCFMRCMLQLKHQQAAHDFFAFHKIKIALISSLLLIGCCCSGFRLLQRPATPDRPVSSTISQNPDGSATENGASTPEQGQPSDSHASRGGIPATAQAPPAALQTPSLADSGIDSSELPAASPSISPASPTPTAATVPLDAATLVYVAKTGRVYHLYATCSYIKGHDGVTELPYAYVGEKSLCSTCKRNYLEQAKQ